MIVPKKYWVSDAFISVHNYYYYSVIHLQLSFIDSWTALVFLLWSFLCFARRTHRAEDIFPTRTCSEHGPRQCEASVSIGSGRVVPSGGHHVTEQRDKHTSPSNAHELVNKLLIWYLENFLDFPKEEVSCFGSPRYLLQLLLFFEGKIALSARTVLENVTRVSAFPEHFVFQENCEQKCNRCVVCDDWLTLYIYAFVGMSCCTKLIPTII